MLMLMYIGTAAQCRSSERQGREITSIRYGAGSTSRRVWHRSERS